MSKIDPELKKKLLKETQTPFKGLRKILLILQILILTVE